MKKIVNIIIWILLLSSIIAGYIYYVNIPIAVDLTVITPKTAELSFSEQGLLVADNVVQIYPLTQGKLIEVKVSEGDEVRAGDVLCVIDSEPFQLKMLPVYSAIKGYEAQIANLSTEQQRSRDELSRNKDILLGELAALEAQEQSSNTSLEINNVSLEEKIRLQNILIEQNQKELERAEDDLLKAETLYKTGIIPFANYEEAQNVVSKCESALELSKQELVVISSNTAQSNEEYYDAMKKSLNVQIESINQLLGKSYIADMTEYYGALIQAEQSNITQLEKEIANCTVVATVDGVITSLNAKSTNFVGSSMPVAEITVSSENVIEVYVSTKDIDSVTIDDTVILTLKRREGDIVFTGKVTDIDSTAEVMLSSLGVEEYKVKVKVSPNMSEIDGASLGIGYNVDVKFLIYSEENKFTVPKTALFKDNNDKDMVWVVKDGKVYSTEVIKGMELRTETVIEVGLMEGDFVVNDANNEDLKNGVGVKSQSPHA